MDFIKKWCNSEYFDSCENPAEEMAQDLQAAIAQAVKEGVVVASTLWLQALDEVNQTFDLVPIEQIKDKAMEKIPILEADNG